MRLTAQGRARDSVSSVAVLALARVRPVRVEAVGVDVTSPVVGQTFVDVCRNRTTNIIIISIIIISIIIISIIIISIIIISIIIISMIIISMIIISMIITIM